jgi:hypothetical protein
MKKASIKKRKLFAQMVQQVAQEQQKDKLVNALLMA